MYGSKTEEQLNSVLIGHEECFPFLSVVFLSRIHPIKSATSLKPLTTLKMEEERQEERARGVIKHLVTVPKFDKSAPNQQYLER